MNNVKIHSLTAVWINSNKENVGPVLRGGEFPGAWIVSVSMIGDEMREHQDVSRPGGRRARYPDCESYTFRTCNKDGITQCKMYLFRQYIRMEESFCFQMFLLYIKRHFINFFFSIKDIIYWMSSWILHTWGTKDEYGITKSFLEIRRKWTCNNNIFYRNYEMKIFLCGPIRLSYLR